MTIGQQFRNGDWRWLPAICLSLFCLSGASAQNDFFGIQVVDEVTGRGVPLIELRTVNQVSYWSDSAGWIAINEPGLVGEEVFFFVTSHGYEIDPDGFGMRGVRFTLKPGGRETVRVKRTNIAERLYRVTGADIYRDSILLGIGAPIKLPLLNARVFGSDSVQSAVFRNRIHWFWGDTNRPKYPLGNFNVPGAVSDLPESGGLDPRIGVDLEYFLADDGFADETCRMPGPGPTWIEGLTVLGAGDQQRMFAGYAKVEQDMRAYERGIVEWNEEQSLFEKRVDYDPDIPAFPMGHTVRHTANGIEYVYFCHPLPHIRVPANPDAFVDLQQYETWTYLKDGSRPADFQLDRDGTGNLVWAWRKNTIRPTRELEQKLVASGKMQPEERAVVLQVADRELPIILHTASIAWNEYRNRWIMIGLEVGGAESMLGEVYYCEADELTGPWSKAVKIVSHSHYSFYNPRLHPMLNSEDGRYVHFEGTYTQTFSAAKHSTPRYDYNQIMYRLDLTDERLAPAQIK